MDLELDSKAAIVTGGSRGIGRATALGLAAEGCGIVICGRGSDDIDRALVDLRQISNHAWGPMSRSPRQSRFFVLNDPGGSTGRWCQSTEGRAAQAAAGSIDQCVQAPTPSKKKLK